MQVVASLLLDLGFEALDAGDLTTSRLLEPPAFLWINQSLFRDKRRHWPRSSAGECLLAR